jgi:alkane 1-monooxygenase
MPWPLLLSPVFVSLPTTGWLLGLPWLGVFAGAVLVPVGEWLFRSHTAPRAIDAVWLLRALMAAVIGQILVLPLLAGTMSPAQWLWLALSLGYVSGGTGIVLAHELGHRRAQADQWLSRVLLSLVAWGPYRIEHNRGHHRHAATFDDPATSRAEESLYSFLPRYWRGVYVNGWRLSHHPAARWHEAGVLLGLTVLVAAALGLLGGVSALAFWALQAATAIVLVSAVDYIEHWGLRRRVTGQGLERMGPAHTWDCANGLSEALLFNLPRHAHHHLAPGLQGHQLQRTPASPQMPTGYAGMVLMAAVPWIWFRVMRPRLQAVQSSAETAASA